MGASSVSATVCESRVYIRATHRDERPVLVYSTNEDKWSTLTKQQSPSAIAVVNNNITLIGGADVSTRKATNTLSTWNEGQWEQVLPPMPTGRACSTVISHDSLLLVTGGLAEDVSSVVNTTAALNVTTMKWTTPDAVNLPMPLFRHHLILCGEYLYLAGGATVYPSRSVADYNFQAWRAMWDDVKQSADPQQAQTGTSLWTQIADTPTLCPSVVSCGGKLYTVGGRTRSD